MKDELTFKSYSRHYVHRRSYGRVLSSHVKSYVDEGSRRAGIRRYGHVRGFRSGNSLLDNVSVVGEAGPSRRRFDEVQPGVEGQPGAHGREHQEPSDVVSICDSAPRRRTDETEDRPNTADDADL